MKVMLSTPSYAGVSCKEYIDSLEESLLYLAGAGVAARYTFMGGCCYIQIARNNIVHDFLQSDCDKLVFIDDDISWSPYDLYRLINCGKPVCAGVYRIKSDTVVYPVVFATDENDSVVVDEGLIEMDRVPTGFLAIDREVFIKIMGNYPQNVYTERQLVSSECTTKFDFFPQGIKNGVWVGEDYAFCKLWRDMGEKIYAIPDMTLKHHSKDTVYTGNMHEYLLRLPGGSKHGIPD